MAWRALLMSALLFPACDYPPPPPRPAPAGVPSDATLLARRPYTLQLPAGYDDTRDWPLVIALHGYGGTGDEMRAFGFARLGRRPEGQYLYVAPTAAEDRFHTTSWNPSPVPQSPWDVAYLRAIVRDVSATHRVDPRRITFIGFSQGAHMAHRMGCDAAEYVSGVVAIAGQVRAQCAPVQPVSVLQVHGTEDEAIGYYGDVNVPGDPSIPSAHETIRTWAHADACTGPLTATGVTMDLDLAVDGGETRVEAYEGCPAGIGVELWTMQGSAHRPALAPDYAERLYGFLAAHPRP